MDDFDLDKKGVGKGTDAFDVDEKDVTKAIVTEYMKELIDVTETDVIVVGSGPAGTIAAWKLAEKGLKTVIIEKNIKPGGGMYLGGMLMNKLVVEEPAMHLMREANIKSLKEYQKGLYVGDAHEVATKLLAKAFDAGVKMLNAVFVEDVIIKEGRVCGAVINWHMVTSYPEWVTCTDPLAIKSKVVIDATGHDAEVAQKAARMLGFDVKGVEGAMWVSQSERQVISNTQEICPGLIIAGMSVSGTFMLPRMGPIFGGMFLSGERAAEIAYNIVKEQEKIVQEVKR